MFIEINGLAYNLMFAQSIDKLDEDGKYKILYAISNENKLVEEFDNEADRDAKYEAAQEAGAGASKEVEEEIEQIQEDIRHLEEIGFHPQIVEELPEDPEEFILYLVPASDSEEENLYNEFLYINGEWELIGTTAVDLSNYYTKAEIDKKIFVLVENGTSSTYSIDNASNREILKEILTEIRAGNSPIIILRSTHSPTGGTQNTPQYIYPLLIKNDSLWAMLPPNFNADEIYYGTYYHYNACYRIGYSATITESTITINNISMRADSYYVLSSSSFTPGNIRTPLGTKNTSAYTPTGNYNPATKKYVDDITGALTDLDTTDKTNLVNAINEVAGGFSGVPYILELTETDQYKIPNVYNTFAVYNAVDLQSMSDMINTLYAEQEKYSYIIIKYPGRAILIGISTVGFDTQNTTYQFQCLSMNNNVTTASGDTSRFKLTWTRLVISGSWSNNVFTASSNGSTTWEKELPISDRYYMNDNFLSKTNATSYTPTGNYHPATKKYVDDKTNEVKDTFFVGSSDDWNLKTDEEKESYTIAVVADSVADLSQEDIVNINTALGVEYDIESDMSEEDALELANAIIGEEV